MSIDLLSQSLSKSNWQYVNRELVGKILTEFLYEKMLNTTFTHIADNKYLHQLMISESLYYEFTATPRIFGNWHIYCETLIRWENNQPCGSIAVNEFIRDTYQLIGIKGLTLGHLLRELNNTMVADCHILALSNLSVDNLLTLESHRLEGYMHGHPWFVINKGRLGFSYADYLKHAPEMRHPIQLLWIAVDRKRAIFNTHELSYESLISKELCEDDFKKFNNILISHYLSPDDYYFMPVHDWQWQNQLITLFSEDIVNKNIIYLGKAQDLYLPTLSIRTFNNDSDSGKYQVKLPLSIFNTAVYRGLPGDRTQAAPLLTTWLKKKFHEDSFFQSECRLILLGEVTSIDYPHADYANLAKIPYQYKELLGVIWRENVTQYLEKNESIVTMAALIHVDFFKRPFISVLIEKSGLSINDWLREFFSATIPPLLHWLYRYGLVFSPHGENTALILDNYRPVGLVIKDFIDDVNISDSDIPETNDLPHSLKNLLLKVSDSQITQFIHTGLFVVLYRYLSNILQTYEHYDEADFWQQVQDTITQYHHKFPELQARFSKFDLLRESFNKMCLNRIRLLSVGYADYDDRPKVDTIEPMSNPVNSMVIQAWRESSIAPI